MTWARGLRADVLKEAAPPIVERDLGQGVGALLEGHHPRRRPRSRRNGAHRRREGDRLPGQRRVGRGNERRGRSAVMDPLNQERVARAEVAVAAVDGGNEMSAGGQSRGGAARVARAIQRDAGAQHRRRALQVAGAGHEVDSVLEGDDARRSGAGTGVRDRRREGERTAGHRRAVAGDGGGHVDPHAVDVAEREEGAAVQRVHGPVRADDGRHVGLADAGRELHGLGERIGRQVPSVEVAVLARREDAVSGRIDGRGVDAPFAHRRRDGGELGVGRRADDREHFAHHGRCAGGIPGIHLRGTGVQDRDPVDAVLAPPPNAA